MLDLVNIYLWCKGNPPFWRKFSPYQLWGYLGYDGKGIVIAMYPTLAGQSTHVRSSEESLAMHRCLTPLQGGKAGCDQVT